MQPGSAVISVFAARMLLEEAARWVWRFANPDPAAFEARAKQMADDYRARRRKAINMLVGGGAPRRDVERIFAEPPNVRIKSPHNEIAKSRTPLPNVTTMLYAMGEPYPEPGWLAVAYSL